MKRISIIVDDDIEQIAVTTYHRDFPGAEMFDIGSKHSLNIDNGDAFDLRICPDEKTVMDLAINEKKIDIGFIIFCTLFIGLIITVIGLMIYGLFDVGNSITEFSEETKIVREQYAAAEEITAGAIIGKEIVNGHETGGSGIAVNPNNGQYSIIMGGNTSYTPTEYRLYISAECEINDEIFVVERYFDVPAEIYQQYEIGDYFDSQNF